MYLGPPRLLFFLDFHRDALLENHLTELWRQTLNGLGKPVVGRYSSLEYNHGLHFSNWCVSFFQLEQNKLKSFFRFFMLADKPLAETVVAQKTDPADSAGLWLFHSFFQLIVVLAAVRPVTALSAAFFPAPLQPPALVRRSCHPRSSHITPGSPLSNIPRSFVVPQRGAVETGLDRFVPVAAATSRGGALRGGASVVSSIGGGIQILFQRGSRISLFAAPSFNRP